MPISKLFFSYKLPVGILEYFQSQVGQNIKLLKLRHIWCYKIHLIIFLCLIFVKHASESGSESASGSAKTECKSTPLIRGRKKKGRIYKQILVYSSDSDPHKFLCRSGSGIPKMSLSIWIRIDNFYADPDPKGLKIREKKLNQQIFN